MIPFLSPFILRLIGGRVKWLADLLAVLAIVALVFGSWKLWLHFHDKGVIAAHEAEVTAEVELVTEEASEVADAEEAARRAEFEAEQAQSKKEIEDAKANNRSPLDALFR
ncbi:hypothetical protein DXH95_03215 [Sphingorhabdus pulchriflava]|uniref:Uncharacterized protein n=1 Tax=Sphingorhabdus pulchriflava TaxID=2292257 RepID=A0A371BFU8_9SPHN|nr:hypothetical protein [Sphingorhabdus pulchriflava]RDV06450.1 hypothetical protein DXH95_03215 [Sphingorhabdus pulchriflava]